MYVIIYMPNLKEREREGNQKKKKGRKEEKKEEIFKNK